jgi:DNA repair exonuclease SbcCD ATPase subunit
MTYEELTAKLKRGEPLTEEEFKEFGKITRPTERFNEVSAEKQKLNDTIKELNTQIENLNAEKVKLTQQNDDAFNAKLAEMTGRLETLTGENENLKQSNSRYERLEKVARIANGLCKEATKSTFKDTDYLSVLLERKGVDIDKDEDVKKALLELKDEKPEQFVVAVTSGSGTGSGAPNQASGEKPELKTLEERAAYIEKNGFEAYQNLSKGA